MLFRKTKSRYDETETNKNNRRKKENQTKWIKWVFGVKIPTTVRWSGQKHSETLSSNRMKSKMKRELHDFNFPNKKIRTTVIIIEFYFILFSVFWRARVCTECVCTGISEKIIKLLILFFLLVQPKTLIHPERIQQQDILYRVQCTRMHDWTDI